MSNTSLPDPTKVASGHSGLCYCCPHALASGSQLHIKPEAVSAQGLGVITNGAFWHANLLLLVALQLVADVYNINPAPHYAIFNGLLLFLFGLHLYW